MHYRCRSAAWNQSCECISFSWLVLSTTHTADIDLNDIGRGKFDFDVAGHYSRPDVFQLIVNEAPMSAVVATGSG